VRGAVRKLSFVAPGSELRSETFGAKRLAEFRDQERQVTARAGVDDLLQDPVALEAPASPDFGFGSFAA
jgi:hypothetical protein